MHKAATRTSLPHLVLSVYTVEGNKLEDNEPPEEEKSFEDGAIGGKVQRSFAGKEGR